MKKFPTITTKTGDNGKTSLWSGEKVPKNHPAIRCISKLDTFDSYMGVVVNEYIGECYEYDVKSFLIEIQKRFINLKGEIATHPRSWSKFCENFDPINKDDIEKLDNHCDYIKNILEKRGYTINGWIRYGSEGRTSSHLDYLRAICRECEISIYNLNDSIRDESISPNIKQYINRLGDYLFLLARYFKN